MDEKTKKMRPADLEEAKRIAARPNRDPSVPGYKPGHVRLDKAGSAPVRIPRNATRVSVQGVVPVIKRPDVGPAPAAKVPVVGGKKIPDRPGKVEIPRDVYLNSYLEDPDRILPKYVGLQMKKLITEINAVVSSLSNAKSPAQLPILENRLNKVKTSLYIIFNSKYTDPHVEEVFRNRNIGFAIELADQKLLSAKEKLEK